MKKIVIPLKEEVEGEVINGDWTGYFENIQKKLNKSGSRQRSGTIILTDSYPLNRTFNVGSHVELKGEFKAKHHIGSSCGFYATESFDGDWVLKWNKPNSRAYYSNFGAAINQIHVQSKDGLNGVYFRGAQQSAGIYNLVVRGFGQNSIGLRLGGDTYAVRDVFSDATLGGDDSFAREGSTAFEFGERRVLSIRLENITSHNCEYGVVWGDAHQVTIENYESELTAIPLVCTYNPRGINIRNICPRHTENLLNLDKVRWWHNCLIKIDGQMSDNKGGLIKLPTGETFKASSTFDLVIESDKAGVNITNMREMRDFYRDSLK
jgi:hypothetical protein